MNADEALDRLLYAVAQALLALRPAAPDLALVSHCYVLSRVTADALALLGVEGTRLVIGHADGVDAKHDRPVRTRHAWVEIGGKIIDSKLRLAQQVAPGNPLAYSNYVEEPGAEPFGLDGVVEDGVWPILAAAAIGRTD